MADELLIAVDEHDRAVGPRDRASCHRGDGILHRAFSVYLFDARRRLLLQRRSAHKQLWPRVWANSCCSHPRWGETTAGAAHRRIPEELGLRAEVEPLFQFAYHARCADRGSERELCHVFAGVSDGDAAPDALEVEEWRWVAPERLDAELDRDPEAYAPWLRLGWSTLRRDHWRRIDRLCGSAR
jgi:isopentenyl-diphosphate delta-isomerase